MSGRIEYNQHRLTEFNPPDLVDFLDASFRQGCVGCELHCLHLTHEMPVVIRVTVVVAQYSAIAYRALLQIDLSQAVRNHPSIYKPYLLFEQRPFSLSFKAMFLETGGAHGLPFAAHHQIAAQIGCQISCLL